jgi:riboflavin synthase
MFTGIIEAMAKVVAIRKENTNFHFTMEAEMVKELKIDQSLAHNGVCLTVVNIDNSKKQYTVTAIDETMNKTNLGDLIAGDFVNLERCMRMGDRLDGHVVQGHVDSRAICSEVLDQNGSWKYTFEHNGDFTTVEKGSVTINGTSLTVVDSFSNKFSVCIIPYTYEHTVFKYLKENQFVNLEFDILGKYVQTLLLKSGRI